MKIRVVDFETNGFNPTDAIVQIGFTDVVANDGGVKLTPPFSMFVNGGQPLKPEARAVHHIRPRDIDGAPPVEVGIKSLMENSPDIYCAHNAIFEQQFFNPQGSKWICTLKAARRLWPDAPGHGNQCLRYHLDLDNDDGFDPWCALPPHRSGPDAFVTAHLLKRALAMASIEDMVQWTTEPSLLPGNINFGKHKGEPWSKVDPSYLDWIANKSELSDDHKHTARHWLQRRRSDDR